MHDESFFRIYRSSILTSGFAYPHSAHRVKSESPGPNICDDHYETYRSTATVGTGVQGKFLPDIYGKISLAPDEFAKVPNKQPRQSDVNR